MKRRMLPPSRIAPMTDTGYFGRVIGVHFQEINAARSNRAKSVWDAVIYGGVMLFLLVLFGVFAD
jgi:hypothetical protein